MPSGSHNLRRGAVIGYDNGFPKGETGWIDPPKVVRQFAEDEAWGDHHIDNCVLAVSEPTDGQRMSFDVYGNDSFVAPDGRPWTNGRDGGSLAQFAICQT